jgi:transcriptional regulator with XRE-family HTH domain
VAAARLEAGLTQQEFAHAAGAALGMVRKWERGERNPSGAARTLVCILARLGAGDRGGGADGGDAEAEGCVGITEDIALSAGRGWRVASRALEQRPIL